MSNIKNALTRKLGPLPFWVWALIGGVAVYYYRNRIAKPPADAITPTGEVVDSTATPGPPVSIGPGEGIYDPSTGKLAIAPPSAIPPDPKQPPVTLQLPNGGEAIYDPNTGQLLGEPPPTPAAPSGTSTAGKPRFGGVSGQIYGAHGSSGGFKFLGNGRYIGVNGKIVGYKQAHLPQNPVKSGKGTAKPHGNPKAHTPAHPRTSYRHPQTRPRPTPRRPAPRRTPSHPTPRPVQRAHRQHGRG